MKTIFIYSKTVYGNVHWYFDAKDAATYDALVNLTGKYTVTATQVKALMGLGFQVLAIVPGATVDALEAMRS